MTTARAPLVLAKAFRRSGGCPTTARATNFRPGAKTTKERT